MSNLAFIEDCRPFFLRPEPGGGTCSCVGLRLGEVEKHLVIRKGGQELLLRD